MTIAIEAVPQAVGAGVRPGDRVRIEDAPAWCRRHFTGRAGQVVRVVPLAGGDVWVRFEQPVRPWCKGMDAVKEFPFAPNHLASV